MVEQILKFIICFYGIYLSLSLVTAVGVIIYVTKTLIKNRKDR